jgi:phage tail-like protein
MDDFLLQPFRFRVDFFDAGKDFARDSRVPLCAAAFAEASGLEATMEPKTFREGGRNVGDRQLPGRVTFQPVVLKRGVTRIQHLWRWFDLVAGRRYAIRLDARLVVLGAGDDPLTSLGRLEWRMRDCLPTRFRAPTFQAKDHEVAVEELHFVHQGLSLEPTLPELLQ